MYPVSIPANLLLYDRQITCNGIQCLPVIADAGPAFTADTGPCKGFPTYILPINYIEDGILRFEKNYHIDSEAAGDQAEPDRKDE